MAAMELASRRLPESRMLAGDDWFLLFVFDVAFSRVISKKKATTTTGRRQAACCC
jgi:hypothetical protein